MTHDTWRNQMQRVRIEKLVYGGNGLARVEGQVLFVPYTAPGDDALVTINERKRDYLTGELTELKQPGEGRRHPPCPLFQECGGCQLQHLDYARQQLQKCAMLRETLVRGLPAVEIPEINFIAGPEFAYRRNVRFQVHDPRFPIMGFYRARSRQVVDAESCPLLEAPLDAAYGRLRRSGLLAEFTPEQVAGVRAIYSRLQQRTLFAVLAKGSLRGEDPRVLAYFVDDGEEVRPLPTVEEDCVEESVAGRRFRIHPLSFFQSNVFLTEELLRVVGEMADGCRRRDLAVELFSGNGLFTLPLSQHFRSVLAIEQERHAVSDAVRNAALNHVSNAEWIHSPVDGWVEQCGRKYSGVDFLLVDPPREGLSKCVSKWVLESLPAKIVYVSCAPPTLARDLKRWLSNGAYRIERIVGLDLFPQTFHIEAVVSLAAT